MNKNIVIWVVCGGVSTEREVSLKSGYAVYEALRRTGYHNAVLFDLQQDNMYEIIKNNPDVVFLALHGKGGEDGCIQGMLELAGIPYTGPSVAASAVCMNKILTKRILQDAGLPTAKFSVVHKLDCDNLQQVCEGLVKNIGLPMVVKSPCQGSSIGVVLVKNKQKLPSAIAEVFKYGDYLLAEQFVDGIEVTLPILGNDDLQVLPVVEITSEREFYDFTAKYTSGLCHHIIPACIGEQAEELVKTIGVKAYKVLDCKGLSRIDFIIDKFKGPMIIEVNTLPGMTDMSLFPDAARYAGISYESLVEKILELALEPKGV